MPHIISEQEIYKLADKVSEVSVGGGGGRGGTDSLSLGTDLETTAPLPFLATDSPWFCHLQIYSPLFSFKLKDNSYKLSLLDELICLFDLILLNYLFLEQLLMHTFVI